MRTFWQPIRRIRAFTFLNRRARYGGRLVFLLKMGPYVVDPSTVVCKPAYGGNIYLYYSLDGGDVWETLTILETFAYRNEEFTEVNTIQPYLDPYLLIRVLARTKWGRTFLVRVR